MPQPPPKSGPPSRPQRIVYEVVDPRWLLKAAAVMVAVCLLCGYLCLCFLFWQGQWQFVLHPSRTVAQTPQALGLTFQPVLFAVDATGTPQLHGWWIPSDTPAAPTALLLHNGSGSMADALPAAHILHTARLNVFLFDYRGFGASSGPHPTEASMQADAESAFAFLTTMHHTPAAQIIPFGEGLGAALAVRLAADHHEIPAVILDSPDGDVEARIAHDERTRILPLRWLLNEHFALAAPLRTLTTPKLIITDNGQPQTLPPHAIADPRMTVELPHPDSIAYVQALTRFLDLYVERPLPAPIK